MGKPITGSVYVGLDVHKDRIGSAVTEATARIARLEQALRDALCPPGHSSRWYRRCKRCAGCS